MRISDWSSDVCSSDLEDHQRQQDQRRHQCTDPVEVVNRDARTRVENSIFVVDAESVPERECLFDVQRRQIAAMTGRQIRTGQRRIVGTGPAAQKDLADQHDQRSEEHTSELQSLMRISYAASCLKQKNK